MYWLQAASYFCLLIFFPKQRMKHNAFLFFLLAWSVCIGASAQTVKVVRESPVSREAQTQDFAFIEPQTDSARFAFVATLEVTREEPDADLQTLYEKLKKKAQKLGANCFRLRSHEILSYKTTLTLDVFYGTDSVLEANGENHEKNVVYLFGSSNRKDNSCTFKLNDEKKELKGGSFYRIPLQVGKQITLSKGGFTGASVTLTGKEKQPALFLSLTGFGVGPGPFVPGMSMIAFNTGRIEAMERSFGRLLVTVLAGEKQ